MSLIITNLSYFTLAENENTALRHKQKLKNQVATLNDKEFDQFLVNYISGSQKEGKSFIAIQNELTDVGVTISMKQSSGGFAMSSLTATIMSSPEEYYIVLAHRGADSYYRIIAYCDLYQLNPATQDCISIEWDPDDAEYFMTNSGSKVTYRDGTNRYHGIVLFNLDDTTSSTTYAAVYVTPIRDTTDFRMGTKMEHTWDTEKVSWSEALNVSFTAAGAATAGYTYTRSGTTSGLSQAFYADNVATITDFK